MGEMDALDQLPCTRCSTWNHPTASKTKQRASICWNSTTFWVSCCYCCVGCVWTAVVMFVAGIGRERGWGRLVLLLYVMLLLEQGFGPGWGKRWAGFAGNYNGMWENGRRGWAVVVVILVLELELN
ncbi:hypothetical protein KY285_010530 [Solanum tuberosum]|nr:hypothetical protein KY289_011069 [Solanum tuberosum]KAH0734823.1 hypothetical protein KY285_010530 [Solanum tuberosum]